MNCVTPTLRDYLFGGCGCNPGALAILMGIVTVITAGVLAAASLRHAVHRHDPLWLGPVIGSGLLILGVVGQRADRVTESAAMLLACPASNPTHPGMWDVSIQLIGLGFNSVEVVGILVMLLAAAVVLAVERVGVPTIVPSLPPMEADDSV